MRTIYPILLLFIFASCAHLKPDKFVAGQVKVDSNNLKSLTGKYKRSALPDSVIQRGDMFWNLFNRGYGETRGAEWVAELMVVNEKRISVTLLENGNVLKSKVLKGKIKDGYFEFKRRHFIVPALFMNVFRTSKFRIGLLESSSLTTDYREVAWGTAFVVVPFGNNRKQNNYEYIRIE